MNSAIKVPNSAIDSKHFHNYLVNFHKVQLLVNRHIVLNMSYSFVVDLMVEVTMNVVFGKILLRMISSYMSVKLGTSDTHVVAIKKWRVSYSGTYS